MDETGHVQERDSPVKHRNENEGFKRGNQRRPQ